MIMSKNKKVKKEVAPLEKHGRKQQKVNLLEKLRKQADKTNKSDCDAILAELEQASIEGEYVRIVKLKTNQAHYIEKLGLPVAKEDRSGYYEISWK